MDRAPRRAQDVRLGALLVSLDQPLATLEVAVADRAVQGDRRVLESLEEVEVQRALVELVARAHGESVREEGDVVVQWAHGPIHNIADPVPHGQGRQEREHQIRTGPGTPLPERLPEIRLLGLKLEFLLGYVEEAPTAQGRVDQDAANLDGTVRELHVQVLG